MKFTIAYPTLILASITMSGIKARIGGSDTLSSALVGDERNLNSHDHPTHDKYTVYFANSCNSEVGVTAEGHSEVVSPKSCHVFNGGKQYYDSFSYKESGSGEKGGQVFCKNVGSSNNGKCNLLGMPGNACVITIDLCGGPVPTERPTREPERPPAYAPTPEPKCQSHCSKGKPCGDSCIADNTTCTKSRGTACWAKEKCTKFCDKGQACGNSYIQRLYLSQNTR
jgi:hypothetical protein